MVEALLINEVLGNPYGVVYYDMSFCIISFGSLK